MDVEEKQESESQDLNIGALLVEARENQNYSAQDIANQLNLTLSVVEKIEINQFEQEIPLAFIRGYVRSYGQKVGIDINMLCDEFDRQTAKGDEPIQNIQRISTFGEKRREVNSNSPVIKIITYLVIGGILFYGAWLLWKQLSPKFFNKEPETNLISLSHLEKETSEKSKDSASLENTSEDLSIVGSSAVIQNSQSNKVELSTRASVASGEADKKEHTIDGAALEKEQSSSKESVDNEDYSNSLSAKVDDQSNSARSNNLKSGLASTQNDSADLITEPVIQASFSFSNDCWVRISDANGEILAEGIKKNGKVMPLSGVAPWTVILGDASVVTMQVKGEHYDLSNYSPGSRAKFILE